MRQEFDTDRRELEGLIVIGLRELKGLESGLDRQFAGLKSGSSKARESFLLNLMDLEERARWLEQLIDALEDGAEHRSMKRMIRPLKN